ncbi:hypothetical protein [Arthrobacter bussei]|uniref:Lipoprotein n=1 Tax=Arthrobacter bussei TaxID=2594179 RepID=A0A7X1NRK2_9MICC|nr:hypothetical protein [Arthrobacter bussei]MPY11503.1 hypothetical protein [Arthrobacter bussei]
MRIPPSVVGLCALALALAGCSQGDPSPTGTTLTMPAGPYAEPAPGEGPASGAPSPDAGGATGSAATDPSPHCVIVAGGMTTAMLAPLSLRSSTDAEDLETLEEQLLVLRDKVPAELHDDFTRLATSVEAPPEGSGTFDEKAFRRAMTPVQDWLGRHCDRS